MNKFLIDHEELYLTVDKHSMLLCPAISANPSVDFRDSQGVLYARLARLFWNQTSTRA